MEGGPPTGSIFSVSHSNCVKIRSNCVHQSIEQSQVRKKAKNKAERGARTVKRGEGGPHTLGGFHLSGPCLLALPNRLGDPVNGGRKKKKKSKKKKEKKEKWAHTGGGLAWARSRPFSGQFPSFCFQMMVLGLKNRIEKKWKRKTKKWCTHRQNGGGVHPWAQSCPFLIEIASKCVLIVCISL